MNQKDYASIVFPPDETAAMTTAYMKERRDNKLLGVPFGIPRLDEPDLITGTCYLPLMKGEIEADIARPGNGKTGTMVARARLRSRQLKENNITDRLIVYVTLEQSVEELNAFNIAADRQISITNIARGIVTPEEWNKCLEAAIERRYVPIWNIGYSSQADRKQIKIDVDAIGGALEVIRDQSKKEIDIVFIDYLQRIPYDRSESKAVGVSDNYDALKLLALQRIKCPFVVGVQAKREVDQKDDPIPELDDGQWTSNVEQTSDRVISLVRPRKYRKEGEKFGKVTVNGSNQMLVSVLKQKLGPDNFSRWITYNPIYNLLNDNETGISDD